MNIAEQAPVSVEQIVERTGDIEDAVRSVARDADKDIRRFQSRYALPYSSELWTRAFSRRLAFRNNKYRHDVKQRLSDDAEHLHLLYADRRAGKGPFSHLEGLVAYTISHCDDACNLREEAQAAYDTRSSQGTMPAQYDPTVRRSLARIGPIVEKVRKNQGIIKATFDEWKPCMIALCTRQHVFRLKQTLHWRKLRKASFRRACAPLILQLSSLCAERDGMVAKLDFAALIHAAMWHNMLGDQASVNKIFQSLTEYDVLGATIKMKREDQAVVLNGLEELARLADTTPSTLPTPDGAEVAVERLLTTVQEYERLLARCNKTLQDAQRVLKELNEIAGFL
ncbi:hypothetical protein C8Q76DRAFT_795969 [Earliella scabrosa]|nr:hypothetical protein C8Q76DRAFT_795969 [Earliella scabrosa]